MRARTWARDRGFAVRLVASEGSGSHGMLYVGKRETTVRDRKKEMGKGVLAKMLGELGIARDDLEASERGKRL
ncbi:MAG: hypothetical protein OXH99_16270 [Bryobacterales bacterium]|nr:hypothetical protein [Bryobacterales bacterium]